MEEFAVDETDLQSVTTTDSSGGSFTGTEGKTAVQQSVLSDDRYDLYNRDIIESMEWQGRKLNLPEAQGYTEIGSVLEQLDRTSVESILNHPTSRRLHLDYYPGDSDLTVRDILMQKYPDLKPLLPDRLFENLDLPDRDIKLLAALQDNIHDTFRDNLNKQDPNPWYDEPYHSSLLEIACQMKNRKQFVKILLDSGADPNIKNRVTGMPLLHATARSGNFVVLQLLLEKEGTDVKVKDKEGRTVLHWWARVSEKKVDDKEKLEECFDLLHDDIDYNKCFKQKDSSDNTPFSIAVRREYRDRVMLMLDIFVYAADIDDIESAHTKEILESAKGSFVKSILDNCIETNGKPASSEELMVEFKFYPLTNMIYYALDSHHKELLKHPVLSTFINLMWNRVKYIVFFNVAFYVVLLAFLTAYILFSEFCNLQMNRGAANITNDLLSFNNNSLTCGMSDEWRYNTSQYLRYIFIVLWGLLVFREVCQLLEGRMHYIQTKENWLELLLLVVTFTSCSGIVDSFEGNKHLFAFAILLGWFELVLILGRLPVLSVQTEMLKKVSVTFLKYMAGYIFLILAFAISFYILFKENEEGDEVVLFANPLISLVKTIVMFAGEFDASDLPFDTLPGTSHVIFVLFVFFVAIVLLNLLNGLAVGNTRNVMERAEALSLAARVNLINYIFRACSKLPHFIKRYIYITTKFFPNKQHNFGSTDLQSLKRFITEKSERNKKQEETELVENWNLFAQKLSALQLESKKMQQMLENIMTHLSIPKP